MPSFNNKKETRDYCLTMAMAVVFGLYPLEDLADKKYLDTF